MPTIKFTVTTEPVPFKRALSNGKRRFNDPRYSDFKEYVGAHAKIAMSGREIFEGDIICDEGDNCPVTFKDGSFLANGHILEHFKGGCEVVGHI